VQTNGSMQGKAHVAIQQADEQANVVTWGEHVSDEQYARAPSLTEGES
jgi:hypothetical protein